MDHSNEFHEVRVVFGAGSLVMVMKDGGSDQSMAFDELEVVYCALGRPILRLDVVGDRKILRLIGGNVFQ